VIWAISPILAYGTIYRVLAILCSLVWLFIEAFRPNNIFNNASIFTISVVFFLIFKILMKILVPDQFSFLADFQLYIFFLFALMGESLRKRSQAGVGPILLVVMVLMPIWMTTTLTALSTMIGDNGATVTRVLAKSSEEAEGLTELGVGGYGMVYFLVMYIPCMIFLFRNRRLFNFEESWKRKAVTYLTALNILLGIWTVYKADYVFAIFMTLISLMLTFFYNVKSLKRRILFFTVSSSLFLVLPLLLIKYISELTAFFYGTSLHRKLVDIQLSLLSGQSEGTVGDRTERYIRSWNYFIENPIFGTFKRDNLGKHSLILDIFAQYGFFIGILLVFILSYIFLRYMKRSIYVSNIHITMCTMILLISLLNNIGAIQGVVMFLVYPAILSQYMLKSIIK